MRRYFRRPTLLLFVAALVASAGLSYAQFGGGFGRTGLVGEQGDAAELQPAQLPDANVAGCHLLYTSVRREANGAGWRTDYPGAQRHLLLRLSELTKTHVSWREPNIPHVYLVKLTDNALFDCPFVMASDIGTIGMSDEEAARLRLYLEKGGFLWVDDFWGEAAWAQWTRELGKAMPPDIYPIEDIPLNDPMFKSMLEVVEIPQVPSIRFWRGTGGSTSERGEESATVHIRGIRDKHGRIIAVMTHNTD